MNESDTRRTDQLLSWLGRRAPSASVSTVETHISLVAFQADRVYKLKKAVRYSFADFSTPDRRRVACEREVNLNRRLAPDVYLGVEEVLDEAGSVVDHVVVMRRMPESRKLAAIVGERGPATTCGDAVADLLAHFHRAAPTGGVIDDAASPDAVAALWRQEIAECAPFQHILFSPLEAERVSTLARRYLAGRAPLFEERVWAGRARDGHGDLLADDIFCLTNGPRILDCVEFDDRFRLGDVLLDVVFLAMDLERLGQPDLARRFLDRYRAATRDDWPRSLEQFYVAYRAHVRAKVAALRGDDAQALVLMALALTHLEAGRVRLVLVGGPPATGKTTVARAITATTDWQLLRSDVIRKQLAAMLAAADTRAPLDEGLYTSTWSDATYSELCDRASALLGRGESVVLDASWSDVRWRAAASRVARETSSELVAFRCEAPLHVARNRAGRRSAAGTDASDAEADVVDALSERYPQWPEAVVLDTTLPPADVLQIAVDRIGAS